MTRYDNKQLIPGPFLSWGRQNEETEDGTVVGNLFPIEIRGKITPWKGAPYADGTAYTGVGYPADDATVRDDMDKRLPAIFAKQKAIVDMFAQPGKVLEVHPYDGSPPLTCNLRNIKVNFAEGPWVEYCDYTITAEADNLYLNGLAIGDVAATGVHIAKASNEWSIEPADEMARSYRIQHNISAIGKTFYNISGVQEYRPWQYASGYCLNNIGLGLNPHRMWASGVINLTGVQAFDYRRQQTLNELTGQFAVSESWLAYDPGPSGFKAITDYQVDMRTGLDGLTSASYSGQIRGLEERNTTTGVLQTSKYYNAALAWASLQPNIFANTSLLSGLTLNPAKTNATVGLNPVTGVINWNYEYDNRTNPIITGAISSSITVVNRHPTDIVAVIQIPLAAEILQDLDATTSAEKSVSIEAVMTAAVYGSTATAPNTDALVATLIPAGTQIFKKEDVESWTSAQGRYNRNVSWLYK